MRHHLHHRRHLSESPRQYIPEILSGEVLSIAGGVAAGAVLGYFRHSFEPVVGFFLLLPGLMNLPGELQSSLAARIHHGVLRWPSIRRLPSAWRNNITATILLALTGGALIGLAAIVVSGVIFHRYNFLLLPVAILTAFLTNGLLTPLVVYSTHWLNDHGHDPDNVIGAVVTSVGDLVTIVFLATTIALIT